LQGAEGVETVAVIVHYGDPLVTNRCIESIYTQVARIVVVDNQGNYFQVPGTKLIKAGRNIGYGAGCNLGASHCIAEGYDKILFLNNDLVVGCDDFVKKVLQAFEDTGADIITSCLKTSEGRLVFTGASVDISGGSYRNTRPLKMYEKSDMVCGGAFAITVPAWKKLWLREDFFLYCEELDLAFRAKLKGMTCVCCRDVFVIHDDHVRWENSRARYYHARNLPTVMREYWGPSWLWYYWLYFLPVRIVYFAARGNLKCAASVARGALAYLRQERGQNAAIA
jgi:GT2 family glycosyltransferase